jgi:excisionase family DNA binding protein
MSKAVTPGTTYDTLPELMTPEEYASYMRVSMWSTYDNIRHGLIPVVRHGRLVRIPKSVVAPAK